MIYIKKWYNWSLKKKQANLKFKTEIITNTIGNSLKGILLIWINSQFDIVIHLFVYFIHMLMKYIYSKTYNKILTRWVRWESIALDLWITPVTTRRIQLLLSLQVLIYVSLTWSFSFLSSSDISRLMQKQNCDI